MLVLVASLLPLVGALPTNYFANISLTYDGSQLENMNSIDNIPGIDPQMASSLKSAINEALPDYLASLNGSSVTTTMSPAMAAWFNQANLTNFYVNINTLPPSGVSGTPATPPPVVGPSPVVNSSSGVTPTLVGDTTTMASTSASGQGGTTMAITSSAGGFGGTTMVTTIAPTEASGATLITTAVPTISASGTTLMTSMASSGSGATTTIAPSPSIGITTTALPEVTTTAPLTSTSNGDALFVTEMATTSVEANQQTTLESLLPSSGITTTAPSPLGVTTAASISATTIVQTATMGR